MILDTGTISHLQVLEVCLGLALYFICGQVVYQFSRRWKLQWTWRGLVDGFKRPFYLVNPKFKGSMSHGVGIGPFEISLLYR